MIPAQVNHIHVLGALALSLACAPAGNNRQGAETTTVARAETVSVAAKPAPADSPRRGFPLGPARPAMTAASYISEARTFFPWVIGLCNRDRCLAPRPAMGRSQ